MGGVLISVGAGVDATRPPTPGVPPTPRGVAVSARSSWCHRGVRPTLVLGPEGGPGLLGFTGSGERGVGVEGGRGTPPRRGRGYPPTPPLFSLGCPKLS